MILSHDVYKLHSVFCTIVLKRLFSNEFSRRCQTRQIVDFAQTAGRHHVFLRRRQPCGFSCKQVRRSCSNSQQQSLVNSRSKELLSLHPKEFAEFLRGNGIQRCHAAWSEAEQRVLVSHPELQELADWMNAGAGAIGFRQHEAIFMQLGIRTGCLLTAFVWRSKRGQAYGGIRLKDYSTLEQILQDGLRQSVLIGVKSALAGLWVGGGKGIIAEPDKKHIQPEFRQQLFFDYGDFVSSLNGCYIAGLDIGVNSNDMAVVHSRTHWAVNVPEDIGGSGIAAPSIARGVICALEVALEHAGLGDLHKKKVCLQGAGSVGSEVALRLLDHGVGQLYVTDVNQKRIDDIYDLLIDKANGRLTLKKVPFGDTSILKEECDVLVPCALEHVLTAETIPSIQAKIICGPSNQQLAIEEDNEILDDHRFLYIPEFIFNRMAVVNSVSEMFGRLKHDEEIERHFIETWPHSIQALTRKVLNDAKERKTTTVKAANEIAELFSMENHPLWPGRASAIIASLLESDWHLGKDYWKSRRNFVAFHGYA